MPDHQTIYQEEAERYHRLIAKQPDLGEAIEELFPPAGLDVVDLGAGSGRLTVPLAAKAKSIIALDASEAMLEVNAARLRHAGCTNWSTKVADHRSLPLADRSADLIVSGWSIGYLGDSRTRGWEQNIRRVIGEIKRVLRPGGAALVFETMGTGHETPHPPDFLQQYYAALEKEYGFSYQWIRMDYRFESAGEAEELIRFFFGDELADEVAKRRLSVVPECAGVWRLRL
ncbi:class I SAM-dependent methyltransferase [Paenibacillus arenilitoris]|uniref:Class I SAM-dependent methyltransferase n=1 Tax=Paenibacillus arenilitoris TaxID=2772299 RepID=A0A927H675_9BACL|nr:class I SAM-dependent methyltransferase [Paenibacillus arenilitoris]MBD2870256.1 class I SAM-dependent methyltransferase [Paenibacillus arenilitoris]